MAGLKKRSGTYYIRFIRTINGERQEATFSLGTTLKKEAEKMKFQFEDKYSRGEIDPFSGWTPAKEAEKKRQKLRGRYVPLHKAADQFIAQRSQANATTKKNYRRHLDMLIKQLGRTMPVTEIRESDIYEFCFRSDLAPATQASYLRHFKVFFRWLEEQKVLKTDITENIKPPRIPDKIHQKTISKEQLDSILTAFDEFYEEQKKKGNVTKSHQMRDWFKPMILTIYYCGLRAKESVNLTWDDIDLKGNPNDPDDHGHVYIVNRNDNTTKSGKERTIPIRKPLKEPLVNWYKHLGEPNEGYVFPSATGFSPWHKMSAGAVSRSFKKFVRKAKNVPDTVTLHGLRHSCATDLLRQGVPIHIVQKIMGHSSVEVTQIYEHLIQDDITNAIKEID